MPLVFDHVGVAVASLAEGRRYLRDLLHIAEWTEEFDDPVNRVRVQFGRDGSGVCYETIAPFGENSPILLALQKGQRVLNHVAYLVEDLEAEGGRLRDGGCIAAGPANPAVAYGGNRIQFFVSPLKFTIELIEAPGHAHAYRVFAG
jgi:methylmalonyl-CoA/ethylmalonyl-CoA epimerase